MPEQNIDEKLIDYCHTVATMVQIRLGEKYAVHAGKINKNHNIRVGIGIEKTNTDLPNTVFIHSDGVYADNMPPVKAAAYAIMSYRHPL